MKKEWHLVRDFHEAGGHPIADTARPLSAERAEARARWMNEEVTEFTDSDHLVDQVDAMLDLLYFALGTLVEMGVEPSAAFEIVHNANMRKVGNGNNAYRADGKTLKPQDWQGPEAEIASLLGTSRPPGN